MKCGRRWMITFERSNESARSVFEPGKIPEESDATPLDDVAAQVRPNTRRQSLIIMQRYNAFVSDYLRRTSEVSPIAAGIREHRDRLAGMARENAGNLRGASALLEGAPEFSGSSEVAGYDAAGNPTGTTGGTIPEQESDRQARLQRGASAFLPPSERARVEASAAAGQWERDHPFAPSAARPQFMRGASALLAPGQDFSGSSPVTGYDDAGNPIGTTGGLIPEQESDRRVRLQRGASALLPQNVDTIPASLPTPAANGAPGPSVQSTDRVQVGSPQGRISAPTAASLGTGLRALRSVYGVPEGQNGQPVGASGFLAESPGGAEAGGILDLAAYLDNQRRASEADRIARILLQQGAAPREDDTPDVRASKQRYADLLIGRLAKGEDLRAGGSAYMGDRRQSMGAEGSPESTAMLAEIAQRVVQNGRQPRIIRAGSTASGRPVEVLALGNGNFSEVRDPQADQTELAKLLRERAAASRAGDTEAVTNYDRAIENYRADPADRPLRFEEFMQSPSLAKKYEDDYGLYREDFARQMKRVRNAQSGAGDQDSKAMLERIRQERARRAAAAGR